MDALNVHVYDTRDQMGQASANDAIRFLKEILCHQATANVMFGAAPSQNEMLAAMLRSDLDWSRINAFHMDEYIGLPQQHPAGFGNFLRRSLFDHVPFRNIFYLNGSADDLLEECERYASLLAAHPIDVCMLGVGENGHIAFNDPAEADFRDSKTVKIVELDQTCRMQQVHDGCFSSLSEVPTHALTVTIPGMTAARAMFCTVPSVTKAKAVHNMLTGPISPACPASILRLHHHAALYLDRDSATLLPNFV